MKNINFNKNTVLIVDDNPANLGVIFNVLDEVGIEVLVAEDGESAIQKLEYAVPDLILLDVMMPGIDGFETCTRLKANPSTCEIPVIFMTALSQTEHKVKGLTCGGVDYITKPFQKEEVLARIQVQLELRNMARNLAEKNQRLQEEIEAKNIAEKALYELTQKLEKRVEERTAEVNQTLQNLQQAQLRLIQSEKMSALGQLVAGVAHEINNPVGFIQGNLTHAKTYVEDLVEILQLYRQQFPSPGEVIESCAEEIDLDFLMEDLPNLISSMKVGVERIHQISVSLRTFSRGDSTSPAKANIHEGIESTLMILKHRLKASDRRPGIEVLKNYGSLPLVECYSGQLNQVLMNILANAIDALELANEGRTFEEIELNPNKITIYTEVSQDQNYVQIRIADNGVGMPEDVKQKAFDHLFTTKPGQKGTGLGLSISRQIVVEKHQGELLCISNVGKGTEFIIKIPIAH